MWGIGNETYIQKVCRLPMHNSVCIPDFKVHAAVSVVFYGGCSSCNDRIPAIQRFIHIT